MSSLSTDLVLLDLEIIVFNISEFVAPPNVILILWGGEIVNF